LTPLAVAEAPDLLTVKEAARIARIGRNQMYALIKSGQVHAIQLGNSYRIPKERFLKHLGL
jgi:excisionase family DNA binding protein